MNRLMPALRAQTARRLAKAGLPQDRIAEHLGVSQAMVSKYLRAAPRNGLAAAPLVAEIVDASARIVLDDESAGKVAPWCPLCVTLSARGISGARRPLEGVKECLRHEGTGSDDAAAQVLAELAQAEERLHRLEFSLLVPQVRANIAMALPEAKHTREVASFPGRLVEIRGDLKAAAPPEFGSSSHLAHVLLRVRRAQPQARAIMNVRYDDTVRRALRSAGLRARVLQRSRSEFVIAVPTSPLLDAVVDPGAFGIEPALYLLGDSATAVVQKADRILRVLKDGQTK